MGATFVHRPYNLRVGRLPAKKFRLRKAWQAEKEERSSNEKERKMIDKRLESQTFNKQNKFM
eukprot:1152493-Pelagomonas_calceolata.AAC.11